MSSWILTLCVVLGAGVAAGEAGTKRLQPGDFASAETCRPCHDEIYEQWRSSYHSRAATDSVFWKVFQQAVEETGSRVSAICLTCHMPVATVSKEIKLIGPISASLQLSPVAREGVTCDFCHTISGQEFLGVNVSVGAYRVPHDAATDIKYGSHPDASTQGHATEVSTFLEDPILCGICHKYTHPLPGKVLQDTYAEWYYSPYRSQGKRCQDCHMPAYSGRGAVDGPERPDLNAHVFPGGHSEMLKKAATVSLRARQADRSGKRHIRITAAVTNAGSGHLMPTGIPGIRELWLDLRVRDSKGAQVFAQKIPYGATLLDRDGNPAMPWRAVRVGKDTRIAPQKTRESIVRFPVPDGELGTLEAEGTVYYRLLSERIATRVGIEPSPPIPVASDRILISVDGEVSRAPSQ